MTEEFLSDIPEKPKNESAQSMVYSHERYGSDERRTYS